MSCFVDVQVYVTEVYCGLLKLISPPKVKARQRGFTVLLSFSDAPRKIKIRNFVIFFLE